MPAQRTDAIARAQQLLESVRGRALSDGELVKHSVALAQELLAAAEQSELPAERRRTALLARLMHDELGQAFTTLLTDRVYRSREPERIVDAARHLLRQLGIPKYLPGPSRLQLWALLRIGPFLPRQAAEGMLARLRAESSHVVLPAEEPRLARYLSARREQGVRVNVNHLGEAVLGEAEAEARVAAYVELLERPEVESISVKVSSIFSQIDLLAWEPSVGRLVERMRAIYRAALAHPFEQPDGTSTPKLVNLDMEAYRDLHLTLEVFQRTLDEPEFQTLTAGIVLQAYLPDSAPLQALLTDWARVRIRRGGAPIRLRIVKGANLLTERAESAVRGWPVPILPTKADVDASFKRMIEYGCHAEHAKAVRLGVASHNLFDIAFAMVLRAARYADGFVGFELLEGMADPLQRAIHAVARDTLVYAPLVEQASMQTAIAYLMRRLDENTAEQNFLRKSFGLRAGDVAWREQERQFAVAIERRNLLDHRARRRQNRNRTGGSDRPPPSAAAVEPRPFVNEPDTDFSLAHNRTFIAAILQRWKQRAPFDVPLQIGGELRAAPPHMEGFDPSRPGIVPYRFAIAAEDEIARALRCAEQAAASFGRSSLDERAAMLGAVAHGLRAQRGELIAAMVLDAGKRVDQADTEVSEAIDFADYYAQSFRELVAAHPELEFRPKGVALIAPPWNFPLAIPASGVLAALMAGNSVILKPALETVLVAERLAQVCWAAGVPRDVLQLCLCTDELGSRLVSDPRVAQVVLTGATSTAQLFHRLRPGLPLAAETGGKNALIVSAMADRDEAIKDALLSAFGHAGQKCSACSLLVCEAEVYDDPAFARTLADAVASLKVGSAWELESFVTPLIRPPQDALLHAMQSLEDGESWLLEPQPDPDNPRLWTPGIKLGVREGSFMHTTELFGPVLSVMRADDLDHALQIANATPYGLTAGLHSLDEREQQRWQERMQAGNLYINRPITGAIVRRQPFGGFKASGVGPGAKAGGPNYVAQMTDVFQRHAPAVVCPPEASAAELVTSVRRQLQDHERERLSVGACSYGRALREHCGADHDPSKVLGERNVFRYVPCSPLLIRAPAGADPIDVLLACAAARTAGASFELSLAEATAGARPYLSSLAGVAVQVETAAQCGARVAGFARVRVIGTVEPAVLAAAEASLVHVAAAPVLQTGRIELLHYLREQSVSHRYHRYGNLAPAKLLAPLREPRVLSASPESAATESEAEAGELIPS
jgi:RHH-type proline utilization regulon transcriptional repressor/proline dehydrogenase/delta 1-pyrroline-5-carboxylate dehydrogenase